MLPVGYLQFAVDKVTTKNNRICISNFVEDYYYCYYFLVVRKLSNIVQQKSTCFQVLVYF